MDIYYAKCYGKGGGMVSWGKIIIRKRGKKKMENYVKKGEKGLKMHLLNLKRGGGE